MVTPPVQNHPGCPNVPTLINPDGWKTELCSTYQSPEASSVLFRMLTAVCVCERVCVYTDSPTGSGLLRAPHVSLPPRCADPGEQRCVTPSRPAHGFAPPGGLSHRHLLGHTWKKICGGQWLKLAVTSFCNNVFEECLVFKCGFKIEMEK